MAKILLHAGRPLLGVGKAILGVDAEGSWDRLIVGRSREQRRGGASGGNRIVAGRCAGNVHIIDRQLIIERRCVTGKLQLIRINVVEEDTVTRADNSTRGRLVGEAEAWPKTTFIRLDDT